MEVGNEHAVADTFGNRAANLVQEGRRHGISLPRGHARKRALVLVAAIPYNTCRIVMERTHLGRQKFLRTRTIEQLVVERGTASLFFLEGHNPAVLPRAIQGGRVGDVGISRQGHGSDGNRRSRALGRRRDAAFARRGQRIRAVRFRRQQGIIIVRRIRSVVSASIKTKNQGHRQ